VLKTKKNLLFRREGNIVTVMNAVETNGVMDAQRESEDVWTKAVATNPAFDFLNDAAEDIYTEADDRPFEDKN
jgi:hypothetical protein